MRECQYEHWYTGKERVSEIISPQFKKSRELFNQYGIVIWVVRKHRPTVIKYLMTTLEEKPLI